MFGTGGRSRSLVVFVACATALLGACGGGGGSKATNAPSESTAGGNATTTTASGANGDCFTDPGPQHARVRFVNLFTNANYPSGDIDVWQGFSGSDPCGKKLATVPFGTASDYIDVTAADTSGNWNAVAYVAGSTAEDHQIVSQSETWKGGEQITIVFEGPDPTLDNGPAAGGAQVFYEKDQAGDSSSAVAPAPGKAALGIGAASLQYVVSDGVWRAGLVGGSGCLKAVDDTDTTKSDIGGTSLVQYVLDPGSISLGLYPSDPGTCAGTPDIGPATIDAAAGSRTLVLAYGPDAQNLKLLVLPVAA